MFKQLAKISGVILLVLFLMITLAFTSLKYKKVACSSVKVEYAADDVISVNKKVILHSIKRTDKKIIGKTLKQINAAKLEAGIEKNPAILSAEVYKVVTKDTSSYKGVLVVKIKHREPVLRVMNRKECYYIDETGHRFSAMSSCPARVLIATGAITEAFVRQELLPFILYLNKDEFWKAQIEQVQVNKNKNVVLAPLVGNHRIELGTLDSYEKKLRNMKAFYKDVLAKNNWNKYSSINLKYKNQVIAKRR